MGLPAPIVEDRQHSLLMAGLGRVLVPVASRVERRAPFGFNVTPILAYFAACCGELGVDCGRIA